MSYLRFALLLITILGLLRTNAAQASVELVSFTAAASGSAIRVRWQTESELDHSHFNVYRTENSNNDFAAIAAKVRINGAPIQASGGVIGAVYQVVDETANNDTLYYYWLESVDRDSQVEYVGPRSARISGGESGLGAATATSSRPSATASATTAVATAMPTAAAVATTITTAEDAESEPTATLQPTATATEPPPTQLPTATATSMTALPSATMQRPTATFAAATVSVAPTLPPARVESLTEELMATATAAVEAQATATAIVTTTIATEVVSNSVGPASVEVAAQESDAAVVTPSAVAAAVPTAEPQAIGAVETLPSDVARQLTAPVDQGEDRLPLLMLGLAGAALIVFGATAAFYFWKSEA